ncbi:hypothetical protein GCM10010357_47560 [Streptomyces luteireticuli]|uniref:Uncharacterized protein n=1 Tax=Streptomyces luteireticuli TaxID=173858 RepID=A0ABN0YY85_9ACTN
MIGRRLVRLTASWHLFKDRPADGPVDVWLADDRGGSTLITTGSDRCLVVESSRPHDGYDMGECGRIGVLPVHEGVPLADHLGEVVRGVQEEWDPRTGRVALELEFASRSVRCESGGDGDLHILAARPLPRGKC